MLNGNTQQQLYIKISLQEEYQKMTEKTSQISNTHSESTNNFELMDSKQLLKYSENTIISMRNHSDTVISFIQTTQQLSQNSPNFKNKLSTILGIVIRRLNHPKSEQNIKEFISLFSNFCCFLSYPQIISSNEKLSLTFYRKLHKYILQAYEQFDQEHQQQSTQCNLFKMLFSLQKLLNEQEQSENNCKLILKDKVFTIKTIKYLMSMKFTSQDTQVVRIHQRIFQYLFKQESNNKLISSIHSKDITRFLYHQLNMQNQTQLNTSLSLLTVFAERFQLTYKTKNIQTNKFEEVNTFTNDQLVKILKYMRKCVGQGVFLEKNPDQFRPEILASCFKIIIEIFESNIVLQTDGIFASNYIINLLTKRSKYTFITINNILTILKKSTQKQKRDMLYHLLSRLKIIGKNTKSSYYSQFLNESLRLINYLTVNLPFKQCLYFMDSQLKLWSAQLLKPKKQGKYLFSSNQDQKLECWQTLNILFKRYLHLQRYSLMIGFNTNFKWIISIMENLMESCQQQRDNNNACQQILSVMRQHFILENFGGVTMLESVLLDNKYLEQQQNQVKQQYQRQNILYRILTTTEQQTPMKKLICSFILKCRIFKNNNKNINIQQYTLPYAMSMHTNNLLNDLKQKKNVLPFVRYQDDQQGRRLY